MEFKSRATKMTNIKGLAPAPMTMALSMALSLGRMVDLSPLKSLSEFFCWVTASCISDLPSRSLCGLGKSQCLMHSSNSFPPSPPKCVSSSSSSSSSFFLSFGEQTEGSWFNCMSCCFSGWMSRRPISNGLSSLWERWRPPAWSQDWVLILFPWKLSFWWSPHDYLRTRLFTRTQYTIYLISIWVFFFFPKALLVISSAVIKIVQSMFRWNHSFSEHSQAKLRLWLSPHGKTYIFKYIWKYTKNIFDKICFKIYLCKYIFILIYIFWLFCIFLKKYKKIQIYLKKKKYIYISVLFISIQEITLIYFKNFVCCQ